MPTTTRGSPDAKTVWLFAVNMRYGENLATSLTSDFEWSLRIIILEAFKYNQITFVG
jgi:hypothetical protein